MPLQLSPARPADVHRLGEIFIAAFRYDPFDSTLYPDSYKETAIDYIAEVDLYALENDASTEIIKITDTDNDEILAYARWEVPFTFPSEEAKEKAKREKNHPPWPQGLHAKLGDHFNEWVEREKKKNASPETDYILAVLVVDPKHQGKGIGSMLLNYGLEKADKDGAKIYLNSSTAGYTMYAKKGWKEVGEPMIIDVTDWGNPNGGVSKTVCMIREPVTTKTGHVSQS